MWIILPSTSCPSALEEGDSTSASTWRCEMLEQYASLNTKRMPAKSWLRAWKTKPWMKRLFGRICEPSMAARGADSWIASLRETRVRDSAWPENSLERTILEHYGPKFRELYPKYVQLSLFEKTSAADSTITSRGSGPICADSAIELRRYSQRLNRLVRRTRGSVYFASRQEQWGTPTMDNKIRSEEFRKGRTPNLGEVMVKWNTPSASPDAPNLNCNQKDKPGSLGEQSKQWMTPNVPNGGRVVDAKTVARKGMTDEGKRTVGLESQTKHWPTPVANDDNKSPEAHRAMKARMKGGPRKAVTSLNVKVKEWPTPAASNTRSGKASEETMDRNSRPLQEVAYRSSLPVQKTSTDGKEFSKSPPTSNLRSQTKRLNHNFVGWLMGWPLGHTCVCRNGKKG